jgi:hypothetical protein
MKREETKQSIFVDDMMAYIVNPKGSTKKLECINAFIKFIRHKINMQTSIVCLYINHEHMEVKFKI